MKVTKHDHISALKFAALIFNQAALQRYAIATGEKLTDSLRCEYFDECVEQFYFKLEWDEKRRHERLERAKPRQALLPGF